MLQIIKILQLVVFNVDFINTIDVPQADSVYLLNFKDRLDHGDG